MTVSLNFNTMKATPSLCLGRIGEHNATDLEITWTNSDERVASYRVAFQTGGKSILSDSFSSMPIEVALWQQLTLNPRLSIQIIAYDVNGDYIAKSDKFSGLYFAPSVNGINTDIDGEAQDIGAEVTRLEAEVADNTAARHTHSNKTVLDKFGETSGTPTYDGEALGGGLVDDVRNSAGQSLVSNKIAVIPDEVVELIRSYRLGYTLGEITEMFRTKELKINGKTVVDIYSYGTGVSMYMQIYYIDRISGDEYLLYNEYSYDGTTVSTQNKVGRWSEANYTTSEKSKLSGIEAGAEVNDIDTIKPADGTPLTVTDKSVTLPEIPAAQIQADYGQSDNTQVDYIKNKPDLSVYALSSSLGAVATSNDYDDLDNKPTIPSIAGLEATANKVTSLSSSSTDTEYPSAKCVYDELQNIPSMPSGTNTGDILVWNGSAWVSKPKWQMIYQPVEYIQSSGTQYIDTGVPITSDLRMVLERANVNTNECLEGAIRTDNPKASFSWCGNSTTVNNKFSSLLGSDFSTWSQSSVSVDTNKHTFDISSGSQKIDGTEYGTQVIVESAITIGLFVWHNSGGNPWGTKQSAKVYSCKFYNGATLIRDYIPVYNVFTGDIGLFDTINNKFYGKQGTGTFTKGADV